MKVLCSRTRCDGECFDITSRLTYTYEEIWKTHLAVIEMLTSHFEASEEKLVDLVNISSKVEIRPQDREKIFTYLESTSEQIDHSKNILVAFSSKGPFRTPLLFQCTMVTSGNYARSLPANLR